MDINSLFNMLKNMNGTPDMSNIFNMFSSQNQSTNAEQNENEQPNNQNNFANIMNMVNMFGMLKNNNSNMNNKPQDTENGFKQNNKGDYLIPISSLANKDITYILNKYFSNRV